MKKEKNNDLLHIEMEMEKFKQKEKERFWSGPPRHHRHVRRKYMMMDLITTFILILLFSAIYFFSYDPKIADGIKEIKNTYIIIQLSVLLASCIGIIITVLHMEDKRIVIRCLAAVSIILAVALGIFAYVKINYDNTYTGEKFEELYEIQITDKNEKYIYTLINEDGIQLLNEKEGYVYENIKAYDYFSTKVMLVNLLYICAIGFNAFVIIRNLSIIKKQDILNKDDAIVFDEEENVKY